MTNGTPTSFLEKKKQKTGDFSYLLGFTDGSHHPQFRINSKILPSASLH